ncbi:hypothetical protein CO2235_MP70211 [Cupriavidus oxalaticus]|uniref:Uncharacterized protein n=1 Tax=Cupriavidus oxalaticus TaxID=96344 RepID=A0A375GPM3_9BURK|nr:hypothetical protein CO2235_U880029 [Cupriavidus oxalaticus]SPC23523.1 hypothetical protein CO2235_MP70211 [Cupriavidus oxalaticus]
MRRFNVCGRRRLDSFAREPMQVPHPFQGQPGFVHTPV